MNANNDKRMPDPAPITREVARTPVPAEMAAIIRALDAALMADFGAFSFAYAIWAATG